jgi:hypothetical protein
LLAVATRHHQQPIIAAREQEVRLASVRGVDVRHRRLEVDLRTTPAAIARSCVGKRQPLSHMSIPQDF